jgi:protocatechuate 3,4-dioxygenase beta subunit
MKRLLLILLSCITLQSACAQSPEKPRYNNVGSRCEGCEAIFDGMPSPDKMNNVDTLPDFSQPGPKMLVYGTIFKSDGKTPAANTILYIYHTDQQGLYSPAPGQKGMAKRNGALRGWIKTDASGSYKFYTLKPAHYPNTSIPAHIHPIVKEPEMNEYFIDEYLFSDDPFVIAENKNHDSDIGGNGVVTLVKNGDMLMCKRDIILGKNVQNYPK